MSATLLPSAELARYWLETLQRIAPNDNEVDRAAQLLASNRQILTALYDSAAKTAPNGSLFDVTPKQLDHLLVAERA